MKCRDCGCAVCFVIKDDLTTDKSHRMRRMEGKRYVSLLTYLGTDLIMVIVISLFFAARAD